MPAAPVRRSSSDISLHSNNHRPIPSQTLLSDVRTRLRHLHHFRRLRHRHAPASSPDIPSSHTPPSKHVHQSSPNFEHAEPEFRIPYARRNISLNFWQVTVDGSFTRRSLTRQQILGEVRQVSAGLDRPAANRLPRRRREEPIRQVHIPDHPRERRGRGRGRGRPTGSPQTAARAKGNAKRSAGGNRLSVRDMRQIDPSFTSNPAIWVREDAIVVCLESVRAIILHDRMLIFDPDNDHVQTAIWYIKKRLENNIDDVFLPFEFRALEGILVYACMVLEREFLGIEPDLRRTLGDLPTQITNEQLERLRHLEQRLNHYYSRARRVQQALQAVLDENEDMADMYLTEKRKNPGMVRNIIDHDEAEVLLETYLQNVDDLTNKAELLNRAIDDTENLIEIHLDTMQNRLLLVDLIITIINSGLSFVTMMTAIFGMNFPLPVPMSSLPSSKYYFLAAVLIMIFVTLTGLGILTQWCRRQGIYSGRAAMKRQRLEKGVAVKASEETRRQAEALLAQPIHHAYERFSWESDFEEKV